jgi:hypothetical protein
LHRFCQGRRGAPDGGAPGGGGPGGGFPGGRERVDIGQAGGPGGGIFGSTTLTSGQLRFFLLSGAGGFADPGRGGAGGTAAQVTSWAESACAVVPAADYGATSGSAGTLYACGSHG